MAIRDMLEGFMQGRNLGQPAQPVMAGKVSPYIDRMRQPPQQPPPFMSPPQAQIPYVPQQPGTPLQGGTAGLPAPPVRRNLPKPRY